MRIVGIGTDIIEISRIDRLLKCTNSELLDGWFTSKEQAQLLGHAHQIAEMIAIKESIVKVLGTGFAEEVSWTDVELVGCDFHSGKVELHGAALDVAGQLEVTRWLLSSSHSRDYAIATAIALSAE